MPELTWTTTEFKKHDKPQSWYIGLWAVAAVLAIAGIIFSSFLVVILVIVAALVLHIYAAKEPRSITVSLSEHDLVIGERVFPLGEFASFWIFRRRDHDIISLHRHGMIKPELHILIPPEKTPTARMLLRPQVPEKEHDESLIDVLADRLKF